MQKKMNDKVLKIKFINLKTTIKNITKILIDNKWQFLNDI